MQSFRVNKVESLIKDELSLIFLHKIQDPNLGIITITNLKVSTDLRHARVYLSVYNKEKRPEVLERVNEMKGLIRSELAGRIQIRFVPELDFFIDDTLDYVENIERIFKKIHSANGINGNNNKKNGK